MKKSLAGIFGIMIGQEALNQDAEVSTWLVGDEYTIRSMKAPGTALSKSSRAEATPSLRI
ncbi:hypothetical protein [Agriterribacter sp.]|uniref:hypothetical protein n=1 Tax=Agriterribacter sp. TaxID=2821509 RepID=UPI002D1FAEFA|nr:hypothetical protein [Agriterribacter sp.]